MTTSTINRFIRLFRAAFDDLAVPVAMADIELLATLVHHSMDEGRRRYHRSGHVFELCRGMGPRQVLAALFHDVVYFQLDGGLPRRVAPLLEPLLQVEAGSVSLRASALDDGPVAMVAKLFGVVPGRRLALAAGMNEFLSALVAVKSLEAHLAPPDLVAITTAIEATIPFRSPVERDLELFDALPARLVEAGLSIGVVFTSTQVEEVMREAVMLANRDVGSFGEADPGRFLATTWLLIEESNAPLAAVGMYSVQDYRRALVRMEGFLCGLAPERVFHRYSGTPGEADFAVLQSAASRNIAFACQYLGVKILGIAIVEAIALATGADCPVSMLLGDIRSPEGEPEQVEDFLPESSSATSVDLELLRVLEEGRAWESQADLNTSPLSAFVYVGLGAERSRAALEGARRLFEGSLSPRDFLASLDPRVVKPVVAACARIADSRREALLALGKDLGA
jgi:hypothetical protein